MRRHAHAACTMAAILILGSSCIVPGERATPTPGLAVWVTRWDYQTVDDVRTIFRNCAEAGFETVIFQVRGNATTFYPSSLEPWSEEFDHRNPGFDPLDEACRAARLHGLEIQAWVNAVPGWRGDSPPATRDQIFHQQPGWFLYDQDGARQALKKDYYVALNPCLPEVRDHVAQVCAEIAERYPVDAIHLDYIRFLEPDAGRSYPRDPATLGRFREETGLVLEPTTIDAQLPAPLREAWTRWKIDQVTRLVKEIRERVHSVAPRTRLTAAVIRTPSIARQQVLQDWPRWLSEGLVDEVFPMQYDDDDQRFATRVEECVAAVGAGRLRMGVGVYKHPDPAQTVAQIERARQAGVTRFCLFAYASFFESPGTDFEETPPTPELRSLRRNLILSGARTLRDR